MRVFHAYEFNGALMDALGIPRHPQPGMLAKSVVLTTTGKNTEVVVTYLMDDEVGEKTIEVLKRYGLFEKPPE